jgi:hypothetical protein
LSPRAVKTLPDVQPILLTSRRDPFDDPAWLLEPKFDGYRGLLYVTPKGCWFRSKRGNVLKRFEQLCHWVLEELPVKEAILDGEIIARLIARAGSTSVTSGLAAGISTMPRSTLSGSTGKICDRCCSPGESRC